MSSDSENKWQRGKIKPPQWFNGDFFTKVLQHCENDAGIEVKVVNVRPGSKKRGCDLFRAVVEYQQHDAAKTKSMIVKTMSETLGYKKKTVFDTEYGVCTEVLPKFEQILRDARDETVLSARLLYHTATPMKLIVLEDLVPVGYAVVRDRDMNLEEVKTAYYKVAKWHAVSYKLAIEDPSYINHYRHVFESFSNLATHPFVGGAIDMFMETLNEVPRLQKFTPFFEVIRTSIVEKCVASYAEYRENPQENAIYVLCLGDINSNNMMLKNNPETGQLEDVMLVDLHISYMGPIATDIIYATAMLLEPRLRSNHFDEIFYFYMSTFVDTLKKIKFKGRLPKIAEMREQMMRHKHIALYLLMTLRPIKCALKDLSVDRMKLYTSAEYRRSFYRNEEYIEELVPVLEKFLHLGFLGN